MDSMTIPLTQGKVALVDAADYPLVSIFKWHARCSRRKWYAARAVYENGRQRLIWLHRALLGAPDGREVDHVNGDGLDDRRHNLRLSTRVQNSANRGPNPNNTSGYKGVYALEGRWAAAVSGRYLGLFDTPEQAAHAYDGAANVAFGEFARLNFPDDETPEPSNRLRTRLRSNTSGYTGVSYRKDEQKWTARVTEDGRRVFLGYFATAEEAAKAYDARASLLSTPVRLNFP